MESWFYHQRLNRQSLEQALPSLIEKSLANGWRVVIQATSEERLEALDHWLWTYSDASFLAHGRSSDGDGELQPRRTFRRERRDAGGTGAQGAVLRRRRGGGAMARRGACANQRL